MTPFEQAKLLSSKEDDIINLMLEKAKAEISGYLKQDYSPTFDNILVDMTIVKLNRMGTEGLISQGYSGANWEEISQGISETTQQIKESAVREFTELGDDICNKLEVAKNFFKGIWEQISQIKQQYCHFQKQRPRWRDNDRAYFGHTRYQH